MKNSFTALFLFLFLSGSLVTKTTVGYSLFSIDEMEFEDDGSRLQVDENNATAMTNFIEGGGLFAFAQLNIAIPFN